MSQHAIFCSEENKFYESAGIKLKQNGRTSAWKVSRRIVSSTDLAILAAGYELYEEFDFLLLAQELK